MSGERASTPRDGTRPDSDGISDEYFNHVAHELRASLNTILGWAELLRTRSFDDTGRVRAAETILRHARQQLWLINDLMDAWRLLSGSLRLNIGPVDLGALVDSAARVIEPVAAAKNITITLDLAPVAGHVQGDAARLKQAIMALLTNAVHFVVGPSEVDVHLTASTNGATLTVHDHGLAISSDALPYLFDRRRPQEAALASRRGELGVGLSLVRDIVELHGGSIHVESDDTRGVTFSLFLPLEQVPPAIAPSRDPHRETTDYRGHSRLLGLTVLLVDDEEDSREVVAGILSHYGAVVLPAACVADALAALRRERIDVLVTDIAMPGEDGYDLIHRLRKLKVGTELPAAALTAFASEDDRKRALEAGFQVHLSKPIDPNVLIDTVETLGKRAIRPEAPLGSLPSSPELPAVST
jgi:CheY-like chemotaxis protein/two-component sensor histidine kinase